MRIIFLFSVLFPIQALAQQKNDSLWGGSINVIDGVYVQPFNPCSYDSSATMHYNTQFVLSDMSTLNYSFAKGNATYLELIIRTKKCRCSDCQFTKNIIVRIDSWNPDSTLVLTPDNCSYIYWNSWIQPQLDASCKGILRIENGRICLYFQPYFDEKRTIWNPAGEIEVNLE